MRPETSSQTIGRKLEILRNGVISMLRLALAVSFAAATPGCVPTTSTGTPTASLPVQLNALNITSYDSTKTNLVMQGKLETADATPLTVVRFYGNSTCSAPTLGAGTASTLAGAGIPLVVSSVAPTSIYVQTNIDDFCTLLTTYTPTHPAPPPAIFTATVPVSPSHVSSSPIVFGTVSTTTSQVWLYDNANCTHQVGAGLGSSFATTGILVNLTPNTTSSIYAVTVEPFGSASACTALTSYTESIVTPGAPGFTAISPPSPSNSSTTPTITGTLSSTSVTVTLYGDAGCQTSLASGSKANFTGAGIQVTVPANATTPIYAQAVDTAGDLTACTYLTTFVNNSVPPGAPSFTLVNPVSPTRLTIYPLVVGSAAANTAVVALFSNAACTQQIGSGTAAQFAGTGIRAGVTSNAITTVYAEDLDAAGNASACTHMVDYVNNTIPPDPPAFSSTNPISPNNKSYTPYVIGLPSSNTVSVQLYSDITCHTLIGQGTAAQFNGAGIQITAAINAQTTIYAEAFDNVGNVSACTYLANYAYSNLAAPAPSFVSTTPASPSNASTTPMVLGISATTISTVALFSDNACTVQIGHGSRVGFDTIGVQVTVPANTNSAIYALATDVYGNQSPCVLLTHYLHDNIPPPAPTYASTTPLSPNNTSGTPVIQGTAASNPASLLTVSSLTLYDSPSCVNVLGSGTPAQFSSPGLTANVYLNADTSLYAKSADPAGNTSPCTYLVDYVYDTLSPGVPILTAMNPTSPSYSQLSLITGSIRSSSDIEPATTVAFYTDSACSQGIGNGTVTAYGSGGIPLTVPENATSSIYGQSTDFVGNRSACTHLTSFLEADNGPAGFTATLNPDGSVGLQWTPDQVANPTPTYTIGRSLWSGGPYTIVANGVNGNSFRDVSVSNGATYYYVVSATNTTGTSHNSTEASVTISTISPATPTTLVATGGPAQVVLTWSGTSSDMTYSVYRSTSAGGPYAPLSTALPTTTYTDSAVTSGTPYYYVVTGVNPVGESVYSNQASAVPEGIPSAPTSLTITPALALSQCGGGNGIVLVWSAPSYYQSFNIKRATSQGGETTLANIVGNTTYTDCNPVYNNYQFPNGTPNYYTVTATWGPLESSFSNEVGFINALAPTVSANGGNGLGSLTWSSVATATGYNVFRATKSGGNYTNVASNVAGTSYVDSSVTNGTAYYYIVVAIYGTIYGWPSAEVNLTPGTSPSAPSDLVIRPSGNQPVLSWAPPTNFNSFNVYRATTSGGTYSLVGNVATNSYQDAAPLLGMNWYKVTAVWGGVETSATNLVSYRNGVPGSVVATGSTASISISWGTVAGTSTYNVYRSTTSGGPYTSIATPTASPYVDSSVTVGTGYYYVIQSSFADGTMGQYSNQVSAMAGTGKIPSGLTVTLTTGTSVTLQWANVVGATSYKVYDATATIGPFTYTGVASTTNSNTVSGLTSGRTYYFEVTSVVSGVESATSALVSGYTASAPSSPLASPGNGQIFLTWAPVAGATSYNLLRSTDSVNFTALATGLSSTSYTDTTVTNNTQYFYEITAIFSTVSLTSVATTGITPGVTPLAPAGLTVVKNNDGIDVTLTWGGVTGASSYNIYQSTTSGGPYGAPVGSTSSNVNNLVSGLTAGTTYYFVVTALIGTNESATSTQLSVVPAVTPPAPTVVAGATGNATVSWTAVAGASTYDVQRSPDGVNFSTVSSSQSALTYADSGLTNGSPYEYRYWPRNAAGIKMAVSAASVPETPGVAALVPSALIANATGTTQVNLSWVTSPIAASYNVYRGTASGGPYTLLGSVPSPTTAYNDTTVSAGNSYYYVATSVNPSGVESGYSNQASITLLSAPTGLSATAVDNQINLNWTTVGGATSYTVEKSEASTGPFGVLYSGLSSPTYSDTSIVAGETYYYCVVAVMGSGVSTPCSTVASATGVVLVNLQVPIELTDSALASSAGTAMAFLRTQTSFDPTAYNGTVATYLEIVAENTDASARSVALLDSQGVSHGSVSVASGTTHPTRLRTTFTANAALDYYHLQLDGTTSSGQLVVLTARLLVNQTGATQTRLYIPLLSSFVGTPSGADMGAPVATTAGTSYAELPTAIIYNRNVSVFTSLAPYNAWDLETVTAATNGATGYVGLYDTTASALLFDTQTDFQASTPDLAVSPFDEGITGFAAPTNNGDNYELALVCSSGCASGSVSVYKAGLWVNLNPVTHAEILFRDSLGESAIATTSPIDLERTLVDLTLFSNPLVYFEGNAKVGASGSLTLQLNGDGASDFGTSGLSAVGGSSLTLSGSAKTRARTSSPITVTSGNRYLPVATPNGGATPSVVSTSIVIDVSH